MSYSWVGKHFFFIDSFQTIDLIVIWLNNGIALKHHVLLKWQRIYLKLDQTTKFQSVIVCNNCIYWFHLPFAKVFDHRKKNNKKKDLKKTEIISHCCSEVFFLMFFLNLMMIIKSFDWKNEWLNEWTILHDIFFLLMIEWDGCVNYPSI